MQLDWELAHVVEHTAGIWRDLRDARIFITGGTGFFGKWLLASLVAARKRLGVRATATVLTRDPRAFAVACPELAGNDAIALTEGDVRGFQTPAGRFSHVIHAATPASAAFNQAQPWAMFDIIAEGTRRVLEFSRECGAATVLLCSSGAVYGRQPPELARISEKYSGGPDPLDIRSAYGEGKRASEFLGAVAAQVSGMEVKIARGFAFVGPYLPLDAHFAIGNFLGDALGGRTIRIGGDGTPVRSYLHAADLAVWLWTILARGRSGRAYNTGSEEPVSIAELADMVRRVAAPEVRIEIAKQPQPGVPAERYVPSTARARQELGLCQRIPLEDAIRRTAAWHRGL